MRGTVPVCQPRRGSPVASTPAWAGLRQAEEFAILQWLGLAGWSGSSGRGNSYPDTSKAGLRTGRHRVQMDRKLMKDDRRYTVDSS